MIIGQITPLSINIKREATRFFCTPRVMGVINITPDSFFCKRSNTEKDILDKVGKSYIEQGASIVDVEVIPLS